MIPFDNVSSSEISKADSGSYAGWKRDARKATRTDGQVYNRMRSGPSQAMVAGQAGLAGAALHSGMFGGGRRKTAALAAGAAGLTAANVAYTGLPKQAKRVWDLQTGPNRKYAQQARAEARAKRVRKSYGLYARPTTRRERASQRTRNAASAGLYGGVMSGGLTAALNARAGRGAALRSGAQMAGIGGGIGAALGAAQKPAQTKVGYRVKKNYTRYRNGDGTFAGSMLNPPGGVVSDIGEREKVDKALNLRPSLVKPPKPPKAPAPPKPAMPKAPTIPSTRVAAPRQPRIRETGISKAQNLVLKPRPRGFAERQATAQRAARARSMSMHPVAKAERGELLARQFGRDKQQRSTRTRNDRVLQRERFPRKVSKGSPDQSEVSIMGGLGNQRNTRVRRPKYKDAYRRVR